MGATVELERLRFTVEDFFRIVSPDETLDLPLGQRVVLASAFA